MEDDGIQMEDETIVIRLSLDRLFDVARGEFLLRASIGDIENVLKEAIAAVRRDGAGETWDVAAPNVLKLAEEFVAALKDSP